MAFTLKNLENHGGSGAGTKLWSYVTADNQAATKGTGYFNEAAGLLAVNDRIFIAASDFNFDCHVSANAAGVVTIAAIDPFVPA